VLAFLAGFKLIDLLRAYNAAGAPATIFEAIIPIADLDSSAVVGHTVGRLRAPDMRRDDYPAKNIN
jgi:hypothetical protein